MHERTDTPISPTADEVPPGIDDGSPMTDDRSTPRPRLVRIRSVACACNEHARPAP